MSDENNKIQKYSDISIGSRAVAPMNLGQEIEYAKLVAHSKMVPKNYDGNPGAVLVAMHMGRELGLSPVSALQNIAVINGRPSLWGDGALAVVQSHPAFEWIDETDGSEAAKTGVGRCEIKRRGMKPVCREFTVDDAKKAGLWGKQGPWTQYPGRMLQLRARGFAMRDAFSDALRGIAVAEDIVDVVPVEAEVVQPMPTESKDLPEGNQQLPAKRKRGRPRKHPLPEQVEVKPETEEEPPMPDEPEFGFGE